MGQSAPGRAADHRGRGVFAQRVTGRSPLLPAEDEGRLNDAVLREGFTERICAFARLLQLSSAAWQPRDLVSFHARATRGRHANALHHAFSRVSRELARARRADLSARIESFRHGTDPLSVPVAILAHCVPR